MNRLLIVVIVLIPVLATTKFFKSSDASRRQIPNDPTTLEARVKPVKERGEKRVVFPLPEVRSATVSSIDEAVSKYSVLLVEPVDKITVRLDPWSIHTFYKLKILDRLNDGPVSECCAPKDIPEQLSPLAEAEIYLQVYGGTVVVDDVEVTIGPEFSLTPHKQYLLFAAQDHSKKIALVKHGPRAVFSVTKEGRLQPIVNQPNEFSRGIEQKFGGSISTLKQSLAHRPSRNTN